MKRALWIVSAVAVVVVVFAVAAVVALDRGWQRERLRAALEDALVDQLGLDLEIGALDGRLLRAPSLHAIVLPGPGGTPLLEVDAVTAISPRFSFFPLRVQIATLRIEGVRAEIHRDASGRLNIEPLLARLSQDDASTADAVDGVESEQDVSGEEPVVRFGSVDLVSASLRLRWETLVSDEEGAAPVVQESWVALGIDASARDAQLPVTATSSADFRVSIDDGRIADVPVDAGSVVGSVSPQGWLLESADVASPGLAFHASGVGDTANVERLHFSLSIESLERLSEQSTVQASGSLRIDGEIRGNAEAAEVDLHVAARELAIGSQTVGSVDLEARATEDGWIDLRALSAGSQQHPVEATPGGRVRLRRSGVRLDGVRLGTRGQSLQLDGRVDGEGFEALTLVAEGIDVRTASEWVAPDIELGGTAGFRIVLDGPLRTPRIEAAARWRDVTVGAESLGDVELELKLDDDREELVVRLHDRTGSGPPRAVVAVALAERLDGLPDLSWLRSSTFSLRAESRDLDLAPLARLAGVAELVGRLDGSVALQGGDPVPYLERADLRVTGLATVEIPPSDVRLEFQGVGPGSARIDVLELDRGTLALAARPGATLGYTIERLAVGGLVVEGADQRLSLDGAVGRDGFSDLRASVERFDLALLAPVDAPATFAGRVDASARLDGPFDQPRIEARIDGRGLTVEGVEVRSVEIAGQTGDLPGAPFVLAGSLEVGAAGSVALSGQLPTVLRDLNALLASDVLDVTLKLESFSLAEVEPWLPSAMDDPRGRIDASLRIVGHRPRPRVTGSLSLTDGGIDVPLIGRRFEPITASLAIRDEVLRLEYLRIGPVGEQARLFGTVELDREDDVLLEFELDLEDFGLVQTDLARARGTGGARIEGPLRSLDIEGRMTLVEVGVRLSPDTSPALREIRVLAADRSAVGDERTELDRLVDEVIAGARIDLELVVAEGARVTGRGLSLDLAGELAYRKPRGGRGLYGGSLRAPRGSYILHGRRFALQRGVLALDGYEVDPLLDIEVAHEVDDVTILAFIGGRASAPTVRLESRPSLSDEDILSLLLFGRRNDDLASGKRAAAESAAAQLAAGMMLGEIESLFGTDLPIDSVDVRFEDDGSLAGIGVGGQLAERIYLRYGRTIGVDPQDEVSIEFRVNRNWSVRSDVTSSGHAGADIVLRHDF